MRDNCGDSVEHHQKLIQPGEAHYEFAPTIWSKSNQRVVCKCTEIAQQIGSQKMAGIQWSKSKSWSGQQRPIMSLPAKFKLGMIISVSENVWQMLKQSDAKETAGIQCSMTKS